VYKVKKMKNQINQYLISLFLFLVFVAIGNSGDSNLQTTLQDFCRFLFGIVADLASVMIVLSSISYTAGQMLGAELRARATVWSQSMLAGAVIGLVLLIIVPYILGILIGKTWNADNCNFS